MNVSPNRNTRPYPREWSRVRCWSDRAFLSLERFLHIEAVSGVVLLLAAVGALVWANSPAAGYHAFWQMPLSLGWGDHVISQSLHFWINDGLMTVFFLVVGMEIRRELHEGALASARQAVLPLAAALGGVVVPAVLYVVMVGTPEQIQGWAVPTATDIAFALGVLALFGPSIPRSVRVFLLALAIIDDIIAVLIIALFYSGGLDLIGFGIALAGILLVLCMQQMGIGSAWAYVLPGAVIWGGVLQTGAHPTLAGVMLGLITPVRTLGMAHSPVDLLRGIVADLDLRRGAPGSGADGLAASARQMRLTQRELVPPVVRVQSALHPWVAYGVMPLFALANAGVSVGSRGMTEGDARSVVVAVVAALLLGKLLGVVGATWLAVRVGRCPLPEGMSWKTVVLIGLLAGIGFTMSIFIATLAYADPALVEAAKLGVLLGSMLAATLALAWGLTVVRGRLLF